MWGRGTAADSNPAGIRPIAQSGPTLGLTVSVKPKGRVAKGGKSKVVMGWRTGSS